MSRKAEVEASPFWKRLVEAWGKQKLPTSQNGVATTLDMSQGSTRRWYTGDGFPKIDELIRIAEKGRVTIDWLLRDTLPKSSPKPGTPLGMLLETWEQLDPERQEHVLEAAQGQLARQHAPPLEKKQRGAVG